MSDTDLKDRVIVVTGAGRGIGRGIAVHLARQGARVVAAEYRINRLESVMAELESIGECLGVECNVGDRDSVFAMIDATVERFGRVDAVVNNAQSFRPVMALEDVTADDMDLLFDTGPKATLWAMQAVFPHMRDQAWGRIVNVASANGRRGAAGYGPYNSSKEAIRGLTRTAAREWGKHGIVVNCYCPASAAHHPEPDDDQRRAAYAAMYADHPLGRDGDAEHDIAPVVAFLCSDACGYLTGETLMIDGGGSMYS